MTPGSDGRRRRARRSGAHRKPSNRRPLLTRTIAAGATVACIGAAYEATAPTVHALAIVFRTPDQNGNINEVRVDILQGNIFDPQLGILGNNVSNNSSTAAGAVSTGKNWLIDNPIIDNPIIQLINRLWNQEIVIGPAAGAINNTTQISFGSFNIFNPQASIFGGNLGNNTTIGNVAMGHGNQATAAATSLPGLLSLFGAMAGNGNTQQLALFSGNIFNPQWSFLGSNTSNNTAVTNVADNNGNNSQTNATSGGLLGAVAHLWGNFLLGNMTGNGNTSQTAVGTSNIFNPQGSIGGNNQSSNTAVTNEAVGNGNGSTTTVGPAGGSGNTIVVGTTGNGNTNQNASSASNISNTQVSIGSVGKSTTPATPAVNQTAGTTGSADTVVSSTSATSTGSAGSSGTVVPADASTPSTQTALHAAVSGTPTGSALSTGSTGSTGSAASSKSGGSTGAAK